MQTGKQFIHETLRRAIVQLDTEKALLDKELAGLPYYYNATDSNYTKRVRRGELIYRRYKLIRKWWARVLGAKGNNSRVMPLWTRCLERYNYPDWVGRPYPYLHYDWHKFPNRKYYLKHTLKQEKVFTLTGTRSWEPNVNEALSLLHDDYFFRGGVEWRSHWVSANEIHVALKQDIDFEKLPKSYFGFKVNYTLPKETAEYCILHIRGAKFEWPYECQTDPHTVDIFTPNLVNLVKREESFNPWRKHMSSKKPHGTLTSWEQLDNTYVLVYEYANGNYHIKRITLTSGDGHMPIHNAFKEWNEQ